MPDLAPNWKSPDGTTNSTQLAVAYPDVYAALAELDALGHRIHARAALDPPISNIDKIVGLSLLTRALTHFVGVRHLLEASAVQPAIILTRAHYETLLSFRYLVHGGAAAPLFTTPSNPRTREARARYYFAAELRRDICRRQAMLDGAAGAKRVQDPKERAALAAEIADEITRLNKHFQTQQKRFGPLPCFPTKRGKKQRYHDDRQWYSFGFRSGKVNSIKSLSKRLKSIDLYFVFYGPASTLGHAENTSHDAVIQDGALATFSPYRADGFEFAAFWSASFQQLALGDYCTAYQHSSLEDLRAVGRKITPALNRLEASPPAGFY